MTRRRTASPSGLAQHILTTAATMVGVSLTAVGLVKVIEPHRGPSLVDEYLALNAVLFSISTILSYLSLKHGLKGRRIANVYEKMADLCFVIGILIMNIVMLLFAYEII